jgi:hypothetical protein
MERQFFPVPIPLAVPEVTAVGAGAARDERRRPFVVLGLLLDPDGGPPILCGLSVADATLLRDCLADVLDYIASRNGYGN